MVLLPQGDRFVDFVVLPFGRRERSHSATFIRPFVKFIWRLIGGHQGTFLLWGDRFADFAVPPFGRRERSHSAPFIRPFVKFVWRLQSFGWRGWSPIHPIPTGCGSARIIHNQRAVV